jgi:hypothetical protein
MTPNPGGGCDRNSVQRRPWFCLQAEGRKETAGIERNFIFFERLRSID